MPGSGPHLDLKLFMDAMREDGKARNVKLTTKRRKPLQEMIGKGRDQ